MKIAFRTDASIQIGTGHVMRCLTLAEELRRQGHECVFVCREHNGHLGHLICQKGFTLHLLAKTDSQQKPDINEPQLAHAGWLGASWQKDAKETSDLLHDQRPDWLVVDHYALDARWERIVAWEVGQIMVIDDLADRAHECAVLLDQNLGRSVDDYTDLVPEYCDRFIGPDYALLRPEFLQFRLPSLKRRRDTELRRILISMGGTDTPNTTTEVLKSLEVSGLPSSIQLDVIMGTTAPWLDEVQKVSQKSRFDIHVSTGVRNMAERMCLADLSIGAAGSTSWERCVLGLPSVLVCQAQNQYEILEALSDSGAVMKLDLPFDNAELVDVVNRFFQETNLLECMAEKAARVCDGMGVCRVIEWLYAKI